MVVRPRPARAVKPLLIVQITRYGESLLGRLVEDERERDRGVRVTAAEVHEQTEIQRIESWRMQELERAGFPADAAAELASRHDVDLHGAIDLVRRGCPPEVARRILV